MLARLDVHHALTRLKVKAGVRQETGDVRVLLVDEHVDVERCVARSHGIVNERNEASFIAVERNEYFGKMIVEGNVDEVPRVDLVVVVERGLELIVEASRRGQREIEVAELELQLLALVGVDEMQAKVFRA